MATAKVIVPDTKAKGQKRRKLLSKAHNAKLASALADWRASLTTEDKAALKGSQRGCSQGPVGQPVQAGLRARHEDERASPTAR